MNAVKVGAALKAWRKRNKYSLRGLAVALHVDPSAVARWERGDGQPLPVFAEGLRRLGWVEPREE